MNKTTSNCFHVIPYKGTTLITEVPGYELDFDGLKFAVCKLYNRWGIYDPESGMSANTTFETKKEAVAFVVRSIKIPGVLKNAKQNAGKFYKTTAALNSGNFVKFGDL